MALKLFALRWVYFGVRAPGGAFVPDTWNLFDALIVLGATPPPPPPWGPRRHTLGGYTRGTASTPVIVLGATPRHRHHGGRGGTTRGDCELAVSAVASETLPPRPWSRVETPPLRSHHHPPSRRRDPPPSHGASATAPKFARAARETRRHFRSALT